MLMDPDAPVDGNGFQLDAPDRPFGLLPRFFGVVEATGHQEFFPAQLVGIGLRLVGLGAHQLRPAAQLGGLRAQLFPIHIGLSRLLRHGRQCQEAKDGDELFHACL